MGSYFERDLKEQELALLRKSIEECRVKREAQEQRLHSLEIHIEERSKAFETKDKQVSSIKRQLSLFCGDIDAKEREYDAIRRRVEERNREFEAKEEKLKLIQKHISECEMQLRLKEEACNWQHDMAHQVIIERDKTQMEIEECVNNLRAKQGRLVLIEDLIREREQELMAKDMDFHQFLDNIHRDSEEKKDELRALSEKIVQCNMELRTKEEELDAMKRLINGKGNQLDFKRKDLIKSMRVRINQLVRELGSKRKEIDTLKWMMRESNLEIEKKEKKLEGVKDLESMKKQHEGQVKKLESKEKQYEGQVKELASKEKQFKERSNELSSKEKQLNKRSNELSSKEKQLNKRSNELSSKEKQLNERLNELSSKEKQYGDQVKELKSKERQFEEQVKELESKEKRTEGREDGLELKEKQLEGLELELKSREKQFQGEVKELESKRKHVEGQVKELESKEKQFQGQVQELESIQKHIEGQVKELESKEKQFQVQVNELELIQKHFEGQVKEFDSKEKQFQGQVKELESKQKHFEGQVKELESKEKQFQGQVKEFDSKEKQFQGQVKELESKQKHFEGQVKELESKEKLFVGQMKDLESKKNQFEGQVKELDLKEAQFIVKLKELESKERQFEGQLRELDLKEKQYESLRKSFEEEKVLIKKSNILLHQVETEQLYFKDADCVSNSKDLQLLFNLLKKYELLCSQVSDVLHTSADPAKLVLDTIKGFHSPQLRQELIEYDANILRRICSSFLMDELKKSSPVTSLHVKQEAMKLASDWKVNIAAGDKDCLGVLNFLKFVATYEIGSSFNENELQNLLDIIAHHCQTPQALGCIEKLQDNQISPTIDGRDLQLLSDEQTNESELIDNEISVHLQTSLDPAKLVLDIIQNPIVPQNREGNEGVMIDGSHIFLLEQLMRMSPRIEPHVREEAVKLALDLREEAMKLALDLKANMRANTENSLVVLGFLLLLSVYGLVSYFNEDEVLKLFEFAAQHKQAVSLFRTLGFVDKISDFVQNLVQNQQHIEAVRFICAYKLAYKIQPVDLLRQHMLKAKLISKRICRKKKSIEKKVMGRDKEIASLETILQCISDNNLESQDLVNEIQDRILVLEQIKENIVLSASEPSSKVAITWPANEAVTKNQVKKVEQPGEKKPANEAVTKNQVKVQQPGRKRPANEALSKNQVQQHGNKKPANVAVTNNQVKVQQPKEKKHANEAVTKNQVQQPGEKKPASEAVTTNQVRVQQPQKKKRAIEAAPNDHQVQQWGNNSKRPRTAVPSVFPPQHNPVFMPGNERGIIPRPSGIPAQFRPPPNYGFPNPIGAEWRGNTGTNYFGNSRPYPPFR